MTLNTPRLTITDNLTDEDCLAFVHTYADFAKRHGLQTMEPEAFYQPGDLERFQLTVAWWPKDAPPVVSPPLLELMLKGVGTLAGTPPPTTFSQDLTAQWMRCHDWLVAEGRDPKNPNESAEERRKRMARQRVARSRQLKAHPQADQVRALWQVYLDKCQERKDAVAAAHEACTPAIKEAYAAWELAKGK